MTNLEIIRNACIKANPEIMELKFGCEVEFVGENENYCYAKIVEKKEEGIHLISDEFIKDWWIESIYQDNFKIIGRPIRLSDCLLAISKKHTYNNDLIRENTLKVVSLWNLVGDDLSVLSDYSIDNIANLLEEKK